MRDTEMVLRTARHGVARLVGGSWSLRCEECANRKLEGAAASFMVEDRTRSVGRLQPREEPSTGSRLGRNPGAREILF